MKKIRVVIADDHPIFRKGLLLAVSNEKSINVVAEAENGQEALEFAEELIPEVMTLDIEMPVMNGLEVAEEIIKRKLPVKIVVLTMYKEEDMFNEAMDMGIKGYVLKECAVNDIVNGIKTVAEGKCFISPSISEYLTTRNNRAELLLKRKPQLKHLTLTERRVLRLIAENKTSKQIGEELKISYRTVENHRFNICNKLEIHGSHSLLKFAIEYKSIL